MKKILLIEDEKMLAEMYIDKFREAGHDIILMFSAEEALDYLKENKPDLILLDILLPRINGIGFLEEFRKMKEISDILIVCLSNYDDPDVKTKAFDLGVKDYLIKTNYTTQQLLVALSKYLE